MIETRAVGARRRSPVWGVLAVVAAVLCGAMLLLCVTIAFIDLDALVVWMLPVWGIFALLGLAFAIAALAKRGAANITMAAIAGGLLIVSNPVVFLIIGFALGLLR